MAWPQYTQDFLKDQSGLTGIERFKHHFNIPEQIRALDIRYKVNSSPICSLQIQFSSQEPPYTDEVVLPDRGVAAEGPARLQVHRAAGQSDAVVGILEKQFRIFLLDDPFLMILIPIKTA